MALPEAATPSLPAPEARSLSTGTLFAYALPGTGVTFLFTLILVMYMNFATDVLRITPGAMGMIFLVARLWDAVTDPAAGYLSDRTRSRLGRRRSWMLASSVPLALFAFMMFAPPASLEGSGLVAWIVVAIFGFYTAYTVFGVPHMALGAELTQDVRERNRVFGARQLLSQLGLLLAFTVGAALLQDSESARSGALLIGAIGGGATALSIVVAVFVLPRERADYTGRGGQSLLSSMRDVRRNPHARLLLFVFFVETMGMGAIGTTTPYVVKYVVKAPDVLVPALLSYVLPAVVSIPVWVWIGNRLERHRVWLFAMGMSCVGFGSLVFFLGEGTVAIMFVAAALAGTAGGCGATLGQAIKADVIDYDEYQTGERKEGAYFAAWAFVAKVASGVMMGVVGLVLEVTGFQPDVEQSEAARRGMVFLMGGMPLLGFGIGMAAFSRFRLTGAEHARIRREIDARQGRHAP